MSYPLVGNEATITSWAGTANAAMLAKLTDTDFNIDADVEGMDVTGAGVADFALIPGEKSLTAKLSGFLLDGSSPVKVIGSLGDVVLSAGYTNILKRAKFTSEPVAIHDITEMRSSPEFKTFRPDTVLRNTFEFDCLVEDDVDIGDLPKIGDADVTATLTYATGKTLAGSAQILGRRFGMPKDGLQLASFRGEYNGAVTAAGTNAFFTAGALVVPEWPDGIQTDPVLVFNTGGSGTGDVWTVSAFWSRLTVAWEVGKPVTVEIDLQPTGALVKS